MKAQVQVSSGEVSSGLRLETMPLVVVEYRGLQEGFAQLAPCALYNVVAGEVPELIKSTVTLQSLHAKGYRIKEVKLPTSNFQLPTSEQREAA